MGFLSDGKTLTWEEAKKVKDYIKKHGVIQLLHIWNERKEWNYKTLLWGDEIEYIVLKRDATNKLVKLSLRGHDLLPILQQPERDNAATAISLWRPEYGSFMIEGTPGTPYIGDPNLFVYQVELSMCERRRLAQRIMQSDEFIVSMTSFPLNGMGDYTIPTDQPGGDIAKSLFTPDTVINHHPRFATLTRNIRERRTEKVDIRVPLFRDRETKDFPVHPNKRDSEVAGKQSDHWPQAGHVYMDAMSFGMGMCCLQVTLQCLNIDEARHFYDQLAVLAPILMALSAATPIQRGFLVDTDVRWNVISASVDDRTPEERAAGPHHIDKSRYAPISTYISSAPLLKDEYNDVPCEINEEVYQQLTAGGVDV